MAKENEIRKWHDQYVDWAKYVAERGAVNAPTPTNYELELCWSPEMEYWGITAPYAACIKPSLYSESFWRVAMKAFADAS